jgi:hypothetical protein
MYTHTHVCFKTHTHTHQHANMIYLIYAETFPSICFLQLDTYSSDRRVFSVYVYVCVYVCHIRMCVCIDTRASNGCVISVYVCVYVCMYICHTCMCVCIDTTCLYICYICMYVYMHVCMYTEYSDACEYIYVYI